MVAALLVTASLYGKLPGAPLMAWSGTVILLALVNLGMTRRLLKHLDTVSRRQAALRHLAVAQFLSGAAWGILPFLCLATGNTGYLMMSVVLLLALLSLALHTLCLQPAVFYAFCTPTLLPVAVYLSLQPDSLYISLGLGSLVALGLGLVAGQYLSAIGRKGIRDGIRVGILSAQLEGNSADLRTALRSLRRLATRDPLTRSHNRRALLEHLDREMVAQDRTGRTLGLLVVDVDHFKHINDTQGHLKGDEVLKALSARLQSQLRGSDFLSRYGSEEFVCILHVDDPDKLRNAAERLRLAIAGRPLVTDPADLGVTVSIGATLRMPSEEASRLFERAEQALARAKQSGRNRVELSLLS